MPATGAARFSRTARRARGESQRSLSPEPRPLSPTRACRRPNAIRFSPGPGCRRPTHPARARSRHPWLIVAQSIPLLARPGLAVTRTHPASHLAPELLSPEMPSASHSTPFAVAKASRFSPGPTVAQSIPLLARPGLTVARTQSASHLAPGPLSPECRPLLTRPGLPSPKHPASHPALPLPKASRSRGPRFAVVGPHLALADPRFAVLRPHPALADPGLPSSGLVPLSRPPVCRPPASSRSRGPPFAVLRPHPALAAPRLPSSGLIPLSRPPVYRPPASSRSRGPPISPRAGAIPR